MADPRREELIALTDVLEETDAAWENDGMETPYWPTLAAAVLRWFQENPPPEPKSVADFGDFDAIDCPDHSAGSQGRGNWECWFCTGESCATHGSDPCECDSADRHFDGGCGVVSPIPEPTPEQELAAENDSMDRREVSGVEVFCSVCGGWSHRSQTEAEALKARNQHERQDALASVPTPKEDT